MWADYDSEANALFIDLAGAIRAAHMVEIDYRCHIDVDSEERPIGVEILFPTDPYDDLLYAAAERFDLDPEALIAAARAAIAAPDRKVTLKFGARAAV